MFPWTPEQPENIASTDDFHISPYRAAANTPATPTRTWSVLVDGNVYVRAYKGTASRRHQSAVAQRAGRIRVGGIDAAVSFTPVNGEINNRIDDAYSLKYAHSPYLAPTCRQGSRTAPGRQPCE
ncbi:DUF2255 family protein [Arthrobacter sp. NPDC056691]|uniref:DUF2255 family protein n=1 Tax=Arthrobacter sp. NPDC056691 TaxID=3345913 RepID=UPI00366C3A70